MKVTELLEASAETPTKQKPWDGSDFVGKKLNYKEMKAALSAVPGLKASPNGVMFEIPSDMKYTPAQYKKLQANLNSARADGVIVRGFDSKPKRFGLAAMPKRLFVDWDEESHPTKAKVLFDMIGTDGPLADRKAKADENRKKAMSMSKGTGGAKGYFIGQGHDMYNYVFATIDEGPRKGEPVGFYTGKKNLKKGDTIEITYGSTYGSVRDFGTRA